MCLHCSIGAGLSKDKGEEMNLTDLIKLVEKLSEQVQLIAEGIELIRWGAMGSEVYQSNQMMEKEHGITQASH